LFFSGRFFAMLFGIGDSCFFFRGELDGLVSGNLRILKMSSLSGGQCTWCPGGMR
jgi:hypothetical protein